MFSLNPQKIMKVAPWGIFEGSPADLTVLDPARKWTFDVNEVAIEEPEFAIPRMGVDGKGRRHDRRRKSRP